MTTARYSEWRDMAESLRRKISDIDKVEQYDDLMLVKYLTGALTSMVNVVGLFSSPIFKFVFEPASYSDATVIDENIYENRNNVNIGYSMSLATPGSVGSIETKAIRVSDKQIMMVTLFWTSSGNTSPPTLDISFDKNYEDGVNYPGTFLANESRIDTIVSGTPIDTSGLASRTFSIKWSFASDSDYEIKDTIAKIIAVNSSRFYENRNNIILIAAANILREEATKLARSGNKLMTEILNEKAIFFLSEAQGMMTSKIVTPSVSTVGDGYDRTGYTEKAFTKKSSNEVFVEIRGNTIIGKTIRYI